MYQKVKENAKGKALRLKRCKVANSGLFMVDCKKLKELIDGVEVGPEVKGVLGLLDEKKEYPVPRWFLRDVAKALLWQGRYDGWFECLQAVGEVIAHGQEESGYSQAAQLG